MAGLPLPQTGLVLGPVPASGTGKAAVHGLQAMRVSFADLSVLEQVLKHGADLKISFGKSMRLDYGDQSMEIVSQAELHRHELYKRDDSKHLNFVGVFSHSLEVREADGSYSPNESELKLQKDYELLNEEKAASTTAMVDYGELPQPRNARWGGPLRKAPYLKKQNKRTLSAPSSGPSTPSMRSGRSPLNPTSASTSTSAEARAELEALRIPLIHLLALGSASEHSLASKTRAPEDLVLRVLNKVGNRVDTGKRWALMDEAHKELDVWDFPYISKADREKAIRNCREAFTRLRLQKQAPEWRLLLSPDEREKADLNPEPVSELLKPSSARSSSRPASESGRSPLPSYPETKKPAAKELATKATSKATKPSKADPISRLIGKKKKAAAPAKPKVGRPKSTTTTTKAVKLTTQRQITGSTNPRIKSAEIIVDSDEDVDMEDVKASPAKKLPVSKAASPLPPPPPRIKAPLPKKPSPPVATSDGEDGVYLNPSFKRTPAPTAVKSPVKRQRTSASSTTSGSPVSSQSSLKGHKKSQVSTVKPQLSRETLSLNRESVPMSRETLSLSRESLSQRSSSNSPPKPSPLGSSPPISASDADDAGSTSSSSSPFMLGTSASQSPLDSFAGRNTKPRYVPSSVSSLKRKASSAPNRDEPVRSGVKSSTVQHKRRQLANLPDGQTMKMARRFKEEYSRYERLYREAQTTTDVTRKRETIERVLTLHRHLERLKNRISSLQMAH